MLTLQRVVLLCAIAAGAAACRQADGPIPTPDREQNNEIGDIARDLVNVANKDPQAPDELRSDLMKYAQNREAEQRMQELASAVLQALDGARLEKDTAEAVANRLWVGVTARELSERQVEALGEELKATLASTGVAEARAEAIGDRLGAVQQAITTNQRRWYQVF
jgi:hypothetical protein